MIHYYSHLLFSTWGSDKMAHIVHLLLIWIFCVFTSCISGYYCPKVAKIDRDGLRCYWMPAFTSTWLEARSICQTDERGDLAMVDSVAAQTFIQNSFQLEHPVGVWLRNGMIQGLFDDLDTEDSEIKECTSMALTSGQWMNEQCNKANHVICEKTISVSFLSLESYVTGVPLMSGIYTVSQIQLLPFPPDPGPHMVEIMLFPGLWFSHEGRVLSLDLVSQPSDQLTFVRVQILRPYCSPSHHLVPPGCSSLLNPFSCCSLMAMCNTTGGCARGQYWCHLLEICLPVTSPCSPYHTFDEGRTFALPPRYRATPPFFHLMADVSIMLPPSTEHTHISVIVQDKHITVYPDDVLALQHTRRAGEFLYCVADTSSAWRQSYLSLPGPEWGGWFEGTLSAQPGEGEWLDGLVCDLRVIYEDIMPYNEVSPTTSTSQTNSPIKAESPVTGLQVLHPKLDKDNQMHVAVNIPTLIVIQIDSGANATSSWSAPVSKHGVPFVPSCPAGIPDTEGEGWFSHVYMELSSQGEHTLNIMASNSLNSQGLSVRVVSHIPVTGLSIQPQGFSRVLVDIPQLFTASVVSGSSVKFTWVIDDPVQFPHKGESYSVVFKKPAEYTLKVMANNPVSSQLIEVKLTADVMTPLADLAVISMPEAIAVNTSTRYTIQVKADISIGVTIRWDFGDKTASVSHPVSTPVVREDRYPHQSVKHVYLQDCIHHTFSSPGDYTLRIKAYNKYDQIEKAVTVKIRTPLSRPLVLSSPTVCQVNHTILFEVSLRPSTYGVLFSWNFGDVSGEVKEYNSKVRHVFKRPGTYNVTVTANNFLSLLTNYTAVEAVEAISGLQLNYNGSIELNSTFEISGRVSAGSHLKWTFEFGDGSVVNDHSGSSASHIYKSPGNYTVQVSAYNSAGKEQRLINVEVYCLLISTIIPTDCILSLAEIDFEVFVKGYVPFLTFHWDFGDGTPLSVVKGATTTTHTFLTSGTYTVGVIAHSLVASAHYEASICVEAQITDVTLNSAKSAVAVSEEICFDVSVLPKVTDYLFWWHNNFSSDTVPVKGLSHHCFVFQEEGLFEISVHVHNKVNNGTAKTSILVQRPVSNLSIKYDGNHDAMTVNQSHYFWVELPCKTASFKWDFGDGSKLEGQNQSHVFTFPGRFRVTATASNAISSDSVSTEIEVQVPLSFLLVNTSQPFVEAGKEILITAKTDFKDNVAFYWTMNPSSPPKPGTSTFIHVFPDAGEFQIKVAAQNLVSRVETITHIEVVERIHEVQIQCQGLQSARYFLTNQTILLEATVTRGSNLTYEWTANQRIASNTKQFPLFTNSPGDIHVRVVVSNALGSADSELSLRTIELVSGLIISSPVNATAKGNPVRIFASVASGTDLQYSWFLDAEHGPITSDVPFVLHVFKVTGLVKIRVSVSNVFGSVDATKIILIQEPISEVDFQINGQFQPFFVTSNSLLLLHGSAGPGYVLHWKWVLTILNNTVMVLTDNQNVSYSFADVADHHISLNASNDISWQTVSYSITVQDAILGLLLTASSNVVCEDDPVTLTASVFKGSKVSFSLEFVNAGYSMDILQNFTTSSLAVGNHLLRVTAKNNVSYQTAKVIVRVVERIKGLNLIGCCSAVLEASKNISFQASSGSQANYNWTFLLNGVQSSWEIGQHVYFTPFTNGSLSVTVEADNGFCSQSLTSTATIQKRVKKVKIFTSHDGAFIDYPITFVAITDGGSNLKFIWDFGEGALVTESTKQVHKYNSAGEFVVKLTAFNNISEVSTQMTIEVQKLACIQPHVYIVKEQYKILKSRPSYFEARVDFNGCGTHKASYLWEIFRGQDCLGMDKVSLNDSVDVTTPLLSLPKHALKVGNYCLTFTVRLKETPLQQIKTIKLNVLHSQLVPVITGGSHRLWSSQYDLILDATESFDPDSEEKHIELFQFQWSYTIENTTALSSAVPTLHHPTPGNNSVLVLPRSALLPDRVYHFTLTLYKSGRQPVSVSQSVRVYNATVLPVTVKCVSCNSQFSLHVSYSRNIVLAGCCASCQDAVEYRWTAENQRGESLTLNEVTTLTGSLWREIVIKPGELMEGQEYTFTLNMSEPASGLWGSASISLVPNHPPYGGICTLSPDDVLHFLETMVSYSCSGWMDDDGDSAQLIFSLQVAQCEDFGPLCPLITLYRGTQSMFSSLVPLGSPSTVEKLSVIHLLVLVEDSMGATVIAARKNLTVLLCHQCTMEWLRNKSQSEFWAFIQQGNPQDIIQYSIALTSQLNQRASVSAEELKDKIQIRGNVIQALVSLPVSSLQDAVLISSALALSTVVPSEVQCNGCHTKALKVTEKMIKVIREQTGQGDINPTDTGRNILTVLSSTVAVDQRQRSGSGLKHVDTSETAVSALGQIFELMRSLMLSRMSGEKALSLAVPKISAVGVRGDPTKDLMCTDPLSRCQFHIPSALSSNLKEEKQEVLQILLQMEGEENLFIQGAEPPISTTLVAMEFATPQGKSISIANLTLDTAIQITLHKKIQEMENESSLWKYFALPPNGNLHFTVKAMDMHPHTGLYVSLNFSLIPGSDEKVAGLIWIYIDDQLVHSSEHSNFQELTVTLSPETPVLQHTIFLTPLLNGSAKDLFVKLNSSVSGVDMSVSVCVFSMLCQFFNVDERRWSSDGLHPLSGSSPHTAHCLTHHLTMFGASLFIHPEALLLLPPSEEPVRNVVVGIVCGVLLLIHLLVGLIAHKLDHLESLRLYWVPLCGQKGRYKYRVLVKTGWRRGSGTTAHVGISLYGLSKSGSRHLQREGAFQRNSMDDFQVETDANLGEIWKIRIWHDNTGLDPSWYLQHVIVWDIQTDNMFFFLVDDWLSVENEKNSGRVEKVILASCPQELQQFKRILHSQLLFGFREHHLWISLWERPAHSRFSRAQRVTCCALLLHLYLAAGAVWYGAVGRKGSSCSGPVSTLIVMNEETILAGMTVAVLMFPLQTFLKFLFQKTKSKVTLDVSVPPSPVSHTVEMDVFLSHPDLSYLSFLSLPTGLDSSMYDGPLSPFTNSLQSKKLDSEFWNTPDPGNNSLDQWPSCDSIFGLPELTGTTQLLRRKKALLQLHFSTLTSDHDTLEPIKSSEEDLRTISADLDPTNIPSSCPEASDSGHFTPNDTILPDIQDSLCSEWSDLSVDTPTYEAGFHKSSSSLSVLSDASTFLPSLPPDSISTISNTRIGVVRGVPGLSIPSWVLRVVHLLVAVLLGTCLALVGLYGSRFSGSVVLMWLVSTLSAFLTSALLLEPFAICIQALYLATVVRPVDPEVEECLAQETEVRRTGEDLGDKVHPLCGYGLLQAKEEARKLRTLKALMRSCLVYMVFLLVVLMVNYQEHVQETYSRLLRSAIKQTLISASAGQPSLTALSGWMNAEQWIDERLISHLFENPSLLLIGSARLQKVHFQDFCSQNFRDQSQTGQLSLILPANISSHANPGHQTFSAHIERTPVLSTWLRTKSASCAQTEEVVLGNNSQSTHQILSYLQTVNWLATGTQAVLIEFTQYHKQAGILAPVSVLLDQTQTGSILAFISIQPFHISPLSVPDLHVTLTVLLLLFALCFVSTEIWALIRKPSQYLRQAWCWFQPSLALLALAAAVLRLYFLYTTTVCISRHRSQPSSFADFHNAATLARKSSQLSAILLTFLVLKTVGILRFVRRWLAIGRVIRLVFPQMCGVVFLLLLLFVLFSHTGIMLFSGSEEGFRTIGQASCFLLRLFRGHLGLRRLCEHHPVLGPLYCLSAVGIGFWVLGRLGAAVLIRTYQMVQADIYRPSMEPQDYEMMQFLIKRLKLWMGLSKTKEFRHRVKFEGMLPPPSRSSQGSEISNCSIPLSPVGDRQASSASSMASDSSVISDSFDFHHYVDRLVPCVDSLLAGFDRVNQLNEEVYNFELQLQQIQSNISQGRKLPQQVTFQGHDLTPKPPTFPRHPSTSVLECNPNPASFKGVINTLGCHCAARSESSLMGPALHLGKRMLSTLDEGMNSPTPPKMGIPRRRAWNSVTCHSADTAQRLAGSHNTVLMLQRPRSEDGDRQHVCNRMPIKRQAWQNE